MAQTIRDVERQVRREQQVVLDQQAGQIRKQRWAIVVLAFLTSALLASTIALGVIHGRFLQRCPASAGSGLASDPAVPQAPPLAPPAGRRSMPLVVVPVAARAFSEAPYPVITNSTNGTAAAAPGSSEGRCEPGSVWGGEMLDGLDHGYMPLMQKALSVSPPGLAGDIRDYYHAALRGVFRCGESMELGQLELVAACKTGYVVDGESVECDEGGSYGGNSTSASA